MFLSTAIRVNSSSFIEQVLFLRDKNRLDESLITLDINGGMIKQAEGFMRRKPNANEKAFLEKYAKDKNLKIQKGVI